MSNIQVNIKVSIPVTKGGYTGQRDQWESAQIDHVVSIAPNGNIKLESPNKSVILFSKDDLEAALRALNSYKPAMRGTTFPGDQRRASGDEALR